MYQRKPKFVAPPPSDVPRPFVPVEGAVSMLDGKRYVPEAQTSVLETFRRFGWTPPSELRQKETRQ